MEGTMRKTVRDAFIVNSLKALVSNIFLIRASSFIV